MYDGTVDVEFGFEFGFSVLWKLGLTRFNIWGCITQVRRVFD